MNDEKRPPREIRQRCFAYALAAVRLYQELQQQRDSAGWVLGRQYLRSATAIGANVEEAQSGESRADFIHKISIAQKEARESLYWLRLLREANILQEDSSSIIKETEELIAILTAILVRTKANTEK
jgi:four helix bundle protein